MENSLDLPVSTEWKVTEMEWQTLPNRHKLRFRPEIGGFYLLLSSCNLSNPVLSLGVSITTLNPYGYLPPNQYSALQFQGWMICIYSLLLLFWLIDLKFHWENVTLAQKWAVPVLLGSCLCESAGMYIDLDHFNAYNSHISLLSGCLVLLTAWKNAYFRVLLLFLSTGTGIIHPFLSPTFIRISLYGLLYFLCQIGFVLLEFMVNAQEVSPNSRILAAFPMAGLNTLCLVWVYLTIKANIALLTHIKDPRFRLYVKLRKIVCFAGVLAVNWMVVGGIWKGMGESVELSKGDLVEIMWEIVFLAILGPVLWVIRPKNTEILLEIRQKIHEEEEKSIDVELASTDSFSEAVYRQRGAHSFSITD